MAAAGTKARSAGSWPSICAFEAHSAGSLASSFAAAEHGPPLVAGTMTLRSILILAPARSRRPLAIHPQLGACLAAAMVAVGCATYPQRTAAAFADFQRGQLSQALSAYEKPRTDRKSVV